jgi:Ca2+-transporting ATPase
VPGDIVVVEGGDVITADLRLLASSKLQANESALTGESVPVDKSVEPVAAEAVLAERRSMLFKGTGVTRGAGEGVVVATGLASELGRISALVSRTEAGTTPLERRLDALSRRLITATLGIALVLFGIGMAAGRELALMLETAIALAVAAVPEGLPVVATIALARGMWRMARHNALINRLSAVETLGATGVICTDKTGTLTENRMHVARLALGDGDFELESESGRFEQGGNVVDSAQASGLRQALEVGVLCNNAQWREDGRSVGDPMEVALLAAGVAAGIQRAQLVQEQPEEREEAFETETKMMATYHRREGTYRVAVKGAPEAVLAACTRVLTAGGSSNSTMRTDSAGCNATRRSPRRACGCSRWRPRKLRSRTRPLTRIWSFSGSWVWWIRRVPTCAKRSANAAAPALTSAW